jgi:NAD+ diphosphatase
VEFETMTRFCGRCSTPTEPNPGDAGKRCPSCSATFYPRIAPAVIVLVERKGRILLARGPRHPPGWRSALAGFVEPCESLEEAAIREVREEVSLTITDLRYFESQPWPFGHSLMIGFFARYAAGEIEVDCNEIVEADWFSIDALPILPPPTTIARRLIDAYGARRG